LSFDEKKLIRRKNVKMRCSLINRLYKFFENKVADFREINCFGTIFVHTHTHTHTHIARANVIKVIQKTYITVTYITMDGFFISYTAFNRLEHILLNHQKGGVS
jgi:hypothetical protein